MDQNHGDTVSLPTEKERLDHSTQKEQGTTLVKDHKGEINNVESKKQASGVIAQQANTTAIKQDQNTTGERIKES